MKLNSTLLTIGLGTSILIGGIDAGAQTTANGPYYAMPSWDQTMPAASRFVVLANFNSEAVLDRETGLVWQQNPSSFTTTWFAAQDTAAGCPAIVTGGRSGWRLPRLDELQTLTTGVFTNLPAGHPFGANAQGTFWTSNSSVFSSSSATVAIVWAVGGGANAVAGGQPKSSAYRSWCVRSSSSGFAG